MDQLSATRARRMVVSALIASSALLSWCQVSGADAPSTSAALPTSGLKQYVLPDHTASAMLPPSWKVVQTGVAFISAQGPNGEIAMFGVIVPAHDGNATSVTPTVLNQPYSAAAKDKFTQSLAWVRARNGKPPVPVDFKSEDPITNVPPSFGQCTKFTALVGAQGQLAMEADQCSMPVDKSSGNYKNFFKVVAVSAAQAKAERAGLESILSSFQLNPAALQQVQKSGGGAQAAAAHGTQSGSGAAVGGSMAKNGGSGNGNGSALTWSQAIAQAQAMNLQWAQAQRAVNAINATTFAGEAATNRSVNNFDMGVLRGDTPVYAVGNPNPMFWIGN